MFHEKHLIYQLQLLLELLKLGSCSIWQSRCPWSFNSTETFTTTQIHRLLHIQIYSGKSYYR